VRSDEATSSDDPKSHDFAVPNLPSADTQEKKKKKKKKHSSNKQKRRLPTSLKEALGKPGQKKGPYTIRILTPIEPSSDPSAWDASGTLDGSSMMIGNIDMNGNIGVRQVSSFVATPVHPSMAPRRPVSASMTPFTGTPRGAGGATPGFMTPASAFAQEFGAFDQYGSNFDPSDPEVTYGKWMDSPERRSPPHGQYDEDDWGDAPASYSYPSGPGTTRTGEFQEPKLEPYLGPRP